MKQHFAIAFAFMLTAFSPAAQAQKHCCGSKTALPVYLDDTKNIEQRVEDALSRMTLDEKIGVLTSSLKKHAFYNLLINNILYLCVT